MKTTRTTRGAQVEYQSVVRISGTNSWLLNSRPILVVWHAGRRLLRGAAAGCEREQERDAAREVYVAYIYQR
jgi:hypothetical protein